MHAGDGAGEDDGAEQALEPGRVPGGSEDEEDGKGDSGCEPGDDGGAHDVCDRVDAAVVFDRRVPQVVHTADCRARQDTSYGDAHPADGLVRPYGQEGRHEHQNRHEEGQRREARRVGYLELRLAAGQVDSAVANKVLSELHSELDYSSVGASTEGQVTYHAPNCDAAHRYGGAHEQDTGSSQPSRSAPRLSNPEATRTG